MYAPNSRTIIKTKTSHITKIIRDWCYSRSKYIFQLICKTWILPGRRMSLDSNLHILTKLLSYRHTLEKQRLIIKSATRLLLLYFMLYIFVEIFHKHFISIKMKRFYSFIETSKQLSRTKYD